MAKWKGKTRGGVAGHKIFILILRYCGLSSAYFILLFVALYFLIFTKKKYIFFYFHNILNQSKLKSFISIYLNYYNFGKILIDKAAIFSGLDNKFTFDFDGEDYLREMTNGGMLISAHLGNWEIAGNLLKRIESKVNIVMYDNEHESIKNYLSDVLINRKMSIIIIKDDMSHIYEINNAIKRQELVCIHADRFIEGSKSFDVDIMGKKAQLPVGPFYIAQTFSIPVTFVFAMKEGRRHYHFYATKSKIYESTNRKNEALEQLVEDYRQHIESMIRKYPLQWFNYHKFWED